MSSTMTFEEAQAVLADPSNVPTDLHEALTILKASGYDAGALLDSMGVADPDSVGDGDGVMDAQGDRSRDWYIDATWRAKYSAEQLKAMLAKGEAMPNANGDPSYPIADEEDLKNAIHAVGRGSKNPNAIRLYIMKRAKALGLTNLIPDTWNSDGTLKEGNAALTDNLIRAAAGGLELRDDGPTATLFGYFSTFGNFYEIDSAHEGKFLERVHPRAFDQTIANDRDSMRVLYDHGFDPQIGNKPLGPISVLEPRSKGAYYEVQLLDTDYNRDFIVPALRGTLMNGQAVGSQLGASFRFQVTDEDWNYPLEKTDANPNSLPERTIRAAKVFEFGPVTFPASPTATAGVRSLTDAFYEHLHNDPRFVARFTERVGPAVVERMLSVTPGTPRRATESQTSADGRGRSKSHRAALVWAALNS